MSAGGAVPAGSSRVLRLDPFALPVCYLAGDARADRRVRIVELHRERVILRRAVGGIRMRVSAPLACFLGIAIHKTPDGRLAAVVLEHRDPDLSVPLFVASDVSEASAEWRLWGRVLGLPLLAPDIDEPPAPALAQPGGTRGVSVMARRRPRARLRNRRPSILSRRRSGTVRPATVHRGEREIIARD